MKYYQLEDDNDKYGVLETDLEDIKKLDILIEEYQKSDEEYNVDGLVEYLIRAGYKAKILDVKPIYF